VKHKSYPACVLALLGFLLGATSANCQEKSPVAPDSYDVVVPNVPSTTQLTTCTQNNGNPCPEWLHKLIGQYPPSELADLQLQRDPSTVHFWTYRGSADPPLRTNKQVFRSKLFLATHIGGVIAMIVACRTRNSGEDWGSEVPAVAGVFALDYIQFRFVGGPNAIGPPIYEAIHYGLASAR
jgi:hypothetical protein